MIGFIIGLFIGFCAGVFIGVQPRVSLTAQAIAENWEKKK